MKESCDSTVCKMTSRKRKTQKNKNITDLLYNKINNKEKMSAKAKKTILRSELIHKKVVKKLKEILTFHMKIYLHTYDSPLTQIKYIVVINR